MKNIELTPSTDEIYPKKDVNKYLLQELADSPNVHYYRIQMVMQETIEDHDKNNISNILRGINRTELNKYVVSLAFRTMLEMVLKLDLDFSNTNSIDEIYPASSQGLILELNIRSTINNLLLLTDKLLTADPFYANLFTDATLRAYSTLLLCLERTDAENIKDQLERLIMMLIILNRSLTNYLNSDITVHLEWLNNRVELFF